jgi:hypothetical protein
MSAKRESSRRRVVSSNLKLTPSPSNPRIRRQAAAVILAAAVASSYPLQGRVECRTGQGRTGPVVSVGRRVETVQHVAHRFRQGCRNQRAFTSYPAGTGSP